MTDKLIADFSGINKSIENIHRMQHARAVKEEQYKQAVLNSLRGIERNTASLSEIVTILQTSKENQEQIFNLLVQILEIGKAKSIEEAEGMFRSAMRKITTLCEDVETIQKLTGIATTFLNAIKINF